MSNSINKVAVLGAGVMGSGIAAHLASCGIRVVLLDIVPPNIGDDEKSDPVARNRFAAGGLKAAQKARPAAFLHTAAASLVTIGNLDDDLDEIASCDWVIEVVKEDMAIKQGLLAKVEANWTEGTLVTTNTSGLSIEGMLQGRSDAFKRHFFGTHFFNPVRYMHLLEIISGPETDPAAITRMAHFVERHLGKGVVYAKDTVNFIANRIGVFSMLKTIGAMSELDYTIEEVDKIVGRPMGRPKSAAFRTADVVGLDTFVHVAANCYDNLTADPQRDVFAVPDFLKQMVAKGLKGAKTKAGFYKKEGKAIRTIDVATLEYRDKVKPDLPELKALRKLEDAGPRLKALVEGDGRASSFAWHVLSHSLAYAANIAFEIADDVVNIDRAMRWGFNWDQGPFEAWQSLGVAEATARMRADGLTIPEWVDDAAAAGGFYPASDGEPTYFAPGAGVAAVPTIPGSLSLATAKRSGGVVERNRGASLIDLGDGIACLELHTKMNTIDPDVVAMINSACDVVERDFEGMVIANEADAFGAGANLMLVVMNAKQGKWDAISDICSGFQNANQRLRYLSVPVVSNPHGLCLGGGAELAMAADKMVVAQETYMGLVEVGVGLLPGGGGHLNLLKRILHGVPADATIDRLPLIQRAFEDIALAKVSSGGGEVFSLGFGTSVDVIGINRDRRIADAKAHARFMADMGYQPPRPADNLILPGRGAKAAIQLVVYGMVLSGYASEHDQKIADKVGYILCGGDTDGRKAVSEQHLLDIEREAFLSLVGEPKTIDRMQHMLMHNKPLRN